jgi:acetolactate synthase-1/2/3 large subunit
MKLSDYVIKFIEDLGVKHVFTLSGGGIIHLIDSLGKSEKIQYVCNLHEQGAGIAAEAYSQYTNNLGVALVTTGPGGTNIMTPLAGAYLDSTPMLVIAGQVQRKDCAKQFGVRQLGFQEVNVASMAHPVTKYATTLFTEKDIRYMLELAVFLAKSGRPGPVLVEIPLDIQAKEIDPESLTPYEPYHTNEPTIGELNPTIIVDRINQSKRPIILVGNGVRLSGAQNEFEKFIRRTNIPVLTTWKAADLLDENDPLFVGRPGAIASRGANFNQQNSDLILVLGARLDHGQLAYQAKYFAPNAFRIMVDVDQNEINKLGGVVDAPVPYSVKTFLEQLNNENISIDTSEWLKRCKETYLRYPTLNPNYSRDGNLINLYDFIYELSKSAPEDAIIVPGSSGACSEVVYQSWQIKKGQRLLNTPGLGSMGFGIGAAIGACLGSGNKPTICIEGDGGWVMNIQELEVARRLSLPITFFVLNNNGYGSIRSTQDGYFNGKYVASSPGSGASLPSITGISSGFKIPSGTLTNNVAVAKKVPLYLAQGQRYPVIIEVMVQPDHKTLPRSTVFQNDEGEFETAPCQFMKPPLDESVQQQEMLT